MTFLELQTSVMSRLNLTTTEARTRIKAFINQRYRSLQTSIGLGQVRFGSSTFPTVGGTNSYSPTNLIKPMTLRIASVNVVLDERTMDQLRLMDPDLNQTGTPYFYAISNYGASTCTLFLWPTPDIVYTVAYDGIVRGTEMVADGDIPVFPEDFHDILTLMASADELLHKEKPALSDKMEQKGIDRTKELRYFLAKSGYLGLSQGDSGNWWWGPWWGSYRGFY